jgi:hypothetical protein
MLEISTETLFPGFTYPDIHEDIVKGFTCVHVNHTNLKRQGHTSLALSDILSEGLTSRQEIWTVACLGSQDVGPVLNLLVLGGHGMNDVVGISRLGVNRICSTAKGSTSFLHLGHFMTTSLENIVMKLDGLFVGGRM